MYIISGITEIKTELSTISEPLQLKRISGDFEAQLFLRLLLENCYYKSHANLRTYNNVSSSLQLCIPSNLNLKRLQGRMFHNWCMPWQMTGSRCIRVIKNNCSSLVGSCAKRLEIWMNLSNTQMPGDLT